MPAERDAEPDQRRPRRLRREWLFCLLAVLLLAGWMQYSKVVAPIDRAIYDRLLKADAKPPHPDVLIVAVDDASLAALGRWPWSRDVHAQLIQRLAAAAPKAVAFDMLFSEPAREPDIDQQLQNALMALRQVSPVFLPITVHTPLMEGREPRPLRPLPGFEAAVSGLGHIHVELDDDSVVRSLYLYEGTVTQRWPSLSLALAQAGGATLLPQRQWEVHAEGGWLRESRRLLPFAGPPGSYKSVPYVALLRGEVPEAAVRGKTVLVGLTATGIGDHYPTPFSSSAGLTPGVEINAVAIDGLLRNRLLRTVDPLTLFVLTLLALVGWMAWLWRLGPRGGLVALLAFGLLAVMLTVALQLAFRLWMPVTAWWISALLGYLLWSWRRLAVLLADLYRRAEALQPAAAGARPAHRQDDWQHVVQALDRGLEAEQQARRQRTEALQLLSHDLRAPQSAVLALLQTAPPTDANQALLHQRIEHQVRSTLSLADDFVLQLRAEGDTYHREDVDLAALLTDIHERAWPLARAKAIQLVLTLPEQATHLPDPQDEDDGLSADEGGCWMLVEPRLLGRALFNLVDNAIKYSPEGRRVELALDWHPGRAAVVTVSDQGVGIAASDLPRLFDRYSRLQPEDGVAGHGLGLTLVKTVVERHGGRVDCRSTRGKGTTFTVELPLSSGAAA